MPKPLEHRKGSSPEGGPERNEHHGDEDEDDRVTKRERLEGRFDQDANPGRRRDGLHGVERLAVQRVQRRPARLLGRQKMSARGGEHVGPPVPGGDEQQDGKQDRVRRKKEGDFAVGETKGPGDLRGDVIANGAGQDASTRCGEMPRSVPLRSGVRPSREFAIQQLFTLCIDQSRAAFLAARRRATKNRSFSGRRGRPHWGVHVSASFGVNASR